jgi:nucleoside-diphosphate-sugar epimerase
MALVLVTGATGRLGSALVEALLARGHSVRAVVRPHSEAGNASLEERQEKRFSASPLSGSRQNTLPPGVERIECDLSQNPLPLAAFQGVQFVVHAAGLVGSHPYGELIAANAYATKHLLSSCPSTVRKVVLASSISVYGDYSGQVADESFAPQTESPYGKSKLMAEEFAKGYCDSLPLVFLRLGMIYGPGFEEGYFPVLRYLSDGKMVFLGEAKNRIPLLHVSDAVSAFLLALGKPTPSCREYNVVGSEQMSQQELLRMAASELGVSPPQKHFSPSALSLLLKFQRLAGKTSLDPENVRQLTLDRAYLCKRAKEELGWEPKVKIADGMREMVRLYRAKEAAGQG